MKEILEKFISTGGIHARNMPRHAWNLAGVACATNGIRAVRIPGRLGGRKKAGVIYPDLGRVFSGIQHTSACKRIKFPKVAPEKSEVTRTCRDCTRDFSENDDACKGCFRIYQEMAYPNRVKVGPFDLSGENLAVAVSLPGATHFLFMAPDKPVFVIFTGGEACFMPMRREP